MTGGTTKNGDGVDGVRPEGMIALTEGLTFSRGMMRSYFDRWVVQGGTRSACPGFLYAVASGLDRSGYGALDPARDTDALALALGSLPDGAHVLSFMAGAVAAGLFDPPGAPAKGRADTRRKLMERVVGCVGGNAVAEILPRATPQNATLATAQAHGDIPTWVDPGHVLPAIIQARRRLCRIVAENNREDIVPLGTGFLIGPSAVITNQHVMDDLASGPFDPTTLTCWFDYSETTGTKSATGAWHPVAGDQIIASSPMGKAQPENAPNRWWEDNAIRNAFLQEMAGNLDYAVLRLDSAPGLQRGWYDLEKLPKAFPSFAIALHHPSGLDQTITMGDMKFSFRKDVRLFHEAPTAQGSSGGLLINEIAEPIGLHHVGIAYRDVDTGPKLFMNVAISLKHIADDLAAKGSFDRIRRSASLAPPLGCVDGVKPLFGRRDLLGKLQQMWEDPKKRILMVHYEPGGTPVRKPGKSFTTEIIEGLFRTPEHKHIVFRAGETEADALSFVSETMDSFASDLVSGLPKTPQTTTAAYVQELVNILVSKMRERLPNQSVWLMIDDLEHHRLSDASGREYLATLYDRIEQIPGLRVVLIGLPRENAIGGVNSANVVTSTISDTDDLSNFDQLFDTWFRQRTALGAAVDDTAIELLSRTMGSYAQQEAPLQAMSRFVVDHMPSDLFDTTDEAEQ